MLEVYHAFPKAHVKLGDRAKTASNRSRRTGSAAPAPADGRVQPCALRTRERRGLLDAPQGCSIAHSLIDLRGGSRSTAEDYWTRQEACSIARRRSDARGRRPLRFYGCGSTPMTVLPTARTDRREAIDDTGEANARRDVRRSTAAGWPIGRIGQQSSEGSAGNRDVSVGRVDGVHDTTPSWESRSNQQKKQISRVCDAETRTAEGIERRRRFAAALPLRVALTARACVRVIEGSVRVAGKGKSLGQLTPECCGVAPDEHERFVKRSGRFNRVDKLDQFLRRQNANVSHDRDGVRAILRPSCRSFSPCWNHTACAARPRVVLTAGRFRPTMR